MKGKRKEKKEKKGKKERNNQWGEEWQNLILQGGKRYVFPQSLRYLPREKKYNSKIQRRGGKNMIFLENIYTPALNLYKPCLPTRINPKYAHALYVICVASIFSNTRSGRPFQVDGVKILREWSYEAFQNKMKRWKDEKMKKEKMKRKC